MEFDELVQRRYSVRGYKRDAVEEEKLRRVFEACRLAPTAANRQPFQMIVIHTEGREAELAKACRQHWLFEAPLVVCMCALADQAWVRRDGKNYAEVDAAIAMDHLILAATNAGLGTCWVSGFDPDALRELLRLPDGVEAIAITPLGYPAADRRPTLRKDISELVRYEHW